MILRGALAAFSAELTDRRKPWRDQKLEDYKKMLQKTAKRINEQGLTKTHKVYMHSLDSSLAQAGCARIEGQDNKASKATRQYLRLISNAIGWSYVLLIFCTLGKHKVEHLDEDQRVKLLKYVAQHRESLFCHRLEDRAIQCQFSKKCMNLISIFSCVLKHCRYQSRPSTYTRLQKAQETRKHRWRHAYRGKGSTKREVGSFCDGCMRKFD